MGLFHRRDSALSHLPSSLADNHQIILAQASTFYCTVKALRVVDIIRIERGEGNRYLGKQAHLILVTIHVLVYNCSSLVPL